MKTRSPGLWLSLCMIEGATRYLVHHTLFPVTISIFHWIQAIHQAWLFASSGTCGGSSGGAGGVVVRVVVVSGAAGSRTGQTRAGAGGAGSAGVAGMAGVAGGGATDTPWLALKTVVTLLSSSQTPTLSLEIGHADSGKGRCSVMLGFVVVGLVDGDGGVNDRRLNGLLLNNWLNGLERECQLVGDA